MTDLEGERVECLLRLLQAAESYRKAAAEIDTAARILRNGGDAMPPAFPDAISQALAQAGAAAEYLACLRRRMVPGLPALAGRNQPAPGPLKMQKAEP